MAPADSTRWSLIRKAAEGLAPDREDFARVYESPARAYFIARWKGTPLLGEVDDAVQDVFVDLFKRGGALSRVEASRPGGFRAFFYGILRKSALAVEARRARRPAAAPLREDEAADEPGLSSVFDREWALALVREAAWRHREEAGARGPEAVRRCEVLRMRFEEGLPVREIAARLKEDVEKLYGEVKRAKKEFERAMREVVEYHLGGSEEDVLEECRRIASII